MKHSCFGVSSSIPWSEHTQDVPSPGALRGSFGRGPLTGGHFAASASGVHVRLPRIHSIRPAGYLKLSCTRNHISRKTGLATRSACSRSVVLSRAPCLLSLVPPRAGPLPFTRYKYFLQLSSNLRMVPVAFFPRPKAIQKKAGCWDFGISQHRLAS